MAGFASTILPLAASTISTGFGRDLKQQPIADLDAAACAHSRAPSIAASATSRCWSSAIERRSRPTATNVAGAHPTFKAE